MRNVTNIYDPSKKFSEYFWEMRAEIPKEKLERFDKWLDDHNMVWAILFDGAENGYMLFADIEEQLLLDGTVLTEDDFIGCIDNFFDEDDVSWVDDTLPNEDMIPDNEFIGGF